MNKHILKSNILDYITNLLVESEYYINFDSIRNKQKFIDYIYKSFVEYNSFVNTTNEYKKKYQGFDFDDNLTNDEIMNTSKLSSLNDFFLSSFAITITNIFQKSIMKQYQILRNHSYFLS